MPALVASLDGPANGALRSAALIALAKLRVEPPAVEGEAPAAALVETFLRSAESSNQEVAESAVVALDFLGDPEAAPLLGGPAGPEARPEFRSCAGRVDDPRMEQEDHSRVR